MSPGGSPDLSRVLTRHRAFATTTISPTELTVRRGIPVPPFVVDSFEYSRPKGYRNRQLVVPQGLAAFDKESILVKGVPHAEGVVEAHVLVRRHADGRAVIYLDANPGEGAFVKGDLLPASSTDVEEFVGRFGELHDMPNWVVARCVQSIRG